MSEAYKKLIKTLQSMFEMDKADLDFGIYRIMNQKRNEINRFLENDLLPQVKNAFANVGNDNKAELQKQLDAEIEQARKYGAPDPENSPAVLEIKKKLESEVDATGLENEVFSKLQTFFSRYYDKGDFISQRRYKADTYAIPYEGEEVKLYWANYDQYYIKSSEHLKDYAFFAKAPNNQEKPVRIRLVEADTEKDNVKAKSGEERRFVIDKDNPLVIKDDELLINFHFIPVGKKAQDKLNAEAVKTIFAVTAPEFSDWLSLLKTPAPTEKNQKRTLLEKHLNDYTARNTFDYFIHKDLGGFLNRELDFFIKNEVINLDDLSEVNFELTEAQLTKAKIIKSIASKIIKMLAQIEDFQKKMWLKKKLILSSNYCFSFGLLNKELRQEVVCNERQISEWMELGFYSQGDELMQLENLDLFPVDTRYFSREFKFKLLSSIDNFEKYYMGEVFYSENFQALNLMQEKYSNQISSIYIDPPYNTDASAILYKNNYKDSSWLSLMRDRLIIARKLLTTESITALAIDDVEFANLKLLGEEVFGKENGLGVVAVRSNPAGRSTPTGFAESHEYTLFFSNSDSAKVGRLPRSEKQASRYSEEDSIGRYEWVNFRKHGGIEAKRSARPKMFYPLFAIDGRIRVPSMEWDSANENWNLLESALDGEEIIYPLSPEGEELRWKWGVDRVASNIHEFKSKPDKNKTTGIYMKSRMKDEGMLPVTWWEDKRYSATQYGTNHLKNIFGTVGDFSFPKSIELVKDCIRVLSNKNNGYFLDFFGGSGTTAEAILDLNDEDNGRRKFILVEMGHHISTSLTPRIKKKMVSKSWKSGRPLESESRTKLGFFKVLQLESYEDSLNNLAVQSINEMSSPQKELLESESLREDYYLNYHMNLDASATLNTVDIEKFDSPFDVNINAGLGSASATRVQNVDLIESFNYLIGLEVSGVTCREGIVLIEGNMCKTDKSALVIWRESKKHSNAFIEQFLNKLKYSPKDSEFDVIYINGDHTLEDPHSKVKLIEAEFKRLMFDVQDV